MELDFGASPTEATLLSHSCAFKPLLDPRGVDYVHPVRYLRLDSETTPVAAENILFLC